MEIRIWGKIADEVIDDLEHDVAKRIIADREEGYNSTADEVLADLDKRGDFEERIGWSRSLIYLDEGEAFNDLLDAGEEWRLEDEVRGGTDIRIAIRNVVAGLAYDALTDYLPFLADNIEEVLPPFEEDDEAGA